MVEKQLLLDITGKKGLAKVDDTPGQNFFCRACLTAKPAAEASGDPRYCQWCFDFLTEEALQLPPGRHPAWLPKPATSPQVLSTALPMAGHNCAPTVSMVTDKPLIMSTLKRGPKHKVLPEDLIVKLAAEGMSPKAIAERLYADGGILVASRTIKRMLLTFASVGKKVVGDG